jgi:hypothetical protein
VRSLSRSALRPRFRQKLSPFLNRGRGECRVPNAPAAWCALGVVSMHTSIHSGGTGIIRHSPRNGFAAYSEFSPVTSSFLPPSPHGLNGFAYPVGPTKPPQGLASATDARTTRLRRTHQCRSSCTPLLTAHEFGSPCDLRRARHRRVHRIPRSTFVTIAIRPLCSENLPECANGREAGWREQITYFGKTEAKYFSREDWTVESTLNCFVKFDFTRTRFCRLREVNGRDRGRKQHK